MPFEKFLTLVALLPVVLPFLSCAALGLLSTFGIQLKDKTNGLLLRLTATLSLVAALAVAAILLFSETKSVFLVLHPHISLHPGPLTEEEAQFSWLLNNLTASFLVVSTTVTAVVASFSDRYLNREKGKQRFVLLYFLFSFGINTLAYANDIRMFLVSWESLEVSSVLLIGFFQARKQPAESGWAAFAIYRICDMGILAAMALLTMDLGHHFALSGSPESVHLRDILSANTHGAALLLCLSAMGKSAQFPFSGWLAKAMEGPTPSSAIFYGALCIHSGAFLLLRLGAPNWESDLAHILLAVAGCTSVLFGWCCSTTRADVKTQLAMSSLIQVGLIFLEIAMGWGALASIHLIGHAIIRTMQFLGSPSVIHMVRKEHAWKNTPVMHHIPLVHFLPPRFMLKLYVLARLAPEYLDALWSEVLLPLLRFPLRFFFGDFEQEQTKFCTPVKSQVTHSVGHTMKPAGGSEE